MAKSMWTRKHSKKDTYTLQEGFPPDFGPGSWVANSCQRFWMGLSSGLRAGESKPFIY